MELKKEDLSAEFEKFLEHHLKELYSRREKNIKRFHITVFNAMCALIIGSLGLIAALAWDEYLHSLLSRLFSNSESDGVKLFFAVSMTVLAVGVTVLLGKSSENDNKS